jgi:DNA topoisomerase IA
MRNERYIVVAEKASVARAIKSAIGPAKADVVVTSVRGHLMNADLPPGYEWGSVDPSEIIKLRRVVDKVSDTKSYNVLRKLFAEGGVLVVATDNDSEGELIGYEVLQVFRDLNGSGECYRMRFNSLNRRELLQSWANLEKGLNWRWVEKARFRQIFDLITGASFTRLLTLAARSYAPVRLISWGSCQTPHPKLRSRKREGNKLVQASEILVHRSRPED